MMPASAVGRSQKRRIFVVSLLIAFGLTTHHAGADFTDVAAAAGVNDGGSAAGVAWADIDNDGWLDLYVNDAGKLYRSNGDGTFGAPLALAGTRQCIFADFDNDGDLDLKVTNHLYRNEGGGTFSADLDQTLGIVGPCNEEGQAWIDYNQDGYIDLCIPDGTCGNYMFANQGDGTFQSLGVNPIGLVPDGNGDFMAVGDYNSDGFVDMLYRITTGNTPLWRANGDGTFTESSAAAGLNFNAGNNCKSGLAFGDYDNDGDLDLYVGVYCGDNVLYENNGNGTFTDVTVAAGVGGGGAATRGVAWGDYDNDGDLDLYVANENAANQLFRNNGDGTFTDVAAAEGVADASASRGVVFADYDNDGDLDLYVANNNQANRLYRNNLDNARSLFVKVRGLGAGFSSCDGIGARVSLYDAGGNNLLAVREVNGGGGYGSQDPLIVHFGLDPAATYTLQVDFPSGRQVVRSGIVPNNVSFTVGATVLDNTLEVIEYTEVTVAESANSTDVAEGSATPDTYTLVLNTQPNADVVVTVDPDNQLDLGAGAGAPITLTFTPANWNTPQTVSVLAVQDDLVENAHTATITHTAASNDLNFNGLNIASVTANITDDDLAGVTVANTDGVLLVTEGQTTGDSYTLVLDGQPADNVVITVQPDAQLDLGAGPAQSTTLTFTPANWNTPQTVSVLAAQDSTAEGTHLGTISHTVSSADPNFDGLAISDLTVLIDDDDTAGISITGDPLLSVSEAGPTSATYTLVLNSQPAADVTITVQPDARLDLGAGPGQPITLTFTAANWNTARAVTVTPIDDSAATGDRIVTIGHTVTSADGNYSGISVPDRLVQIIDDDSPGITQTSPGEVLTVSEAGPSSASYAISLNTQPTATVTISAQPDADLDLGAGPGQAVSLVFTTENWNTPQTISITPVDDTAAQGTRFAAIAHAVSTTDANYAALSVPDRLVQIIDDDSPGITQTSPGEVLTVSEAGPTTASYAISLNTQPTATVTISAQPDADLDLGAGPGQAVSLVFTTENWNTPQTISITPVDDTAAQGTRFAAIAHAVSTTDANYAALSVPDRLVQIIDDDSPAITVTKPDQVLTVAEAGPTSASYDLALTTAPQADVTITVQPDAQLDVGAGPGEPVDFLFTPENWDSPQTVTATAVDDDDDEGTHLGRITHTITTDDDNYADLTLADRFIQIVDNDAAATPSLTDIPPAAPCGLAGLFCLATTFLTTAAPILRRRRLVHRLRYTTTTQR